MVLNRYPLWKNLLVIAVILIAFIYAAPNLFPADPAVQISGANATTSVDENTIAKVKQTLDADQVPYTKLQREENNKLLLRFSSADIQFKAKEAIQQALGEDYIVALNLAPTTPGWLEAIGAMPMKLGLDLRGGVHLLYQVDVDSVVKQRIEGDLNNIGQELRNQHIRYADVSRNATGVSVQFRAQDQLENALSFLNQRFNEFTWTKNNLTLQGVLSPAAALQAHQDTLEQAMNTLRHRVNELGVSEAVVQQQGASRIAVDLPGISDSTLAKNIIGKTATLEFRLVDTEHDARNVVGGITPADSKLYDWNGQPVLLKNQIILHGSSITSASSGMGEDGRPSVDVRLGGGGESLFTKVTSENIGKPMAVVYVEVKSEVHNVNGQKVIQYIPEHRVISVATIQSALGTPFQVTGLSSQNEARTLALLLRAGALPAPVTVIEERSLGPSLGKQNIHQGVMSVAVGFILIVIFMAIYYRVLGLVADLALGMNLILIVAILSLLGATLTLPGIAGMVLTVGIAADANVLIFERIREELRNGAGIQASINAGYERALVTIIDANVTTLIVAIVLFSLGSGVVKNFAVTLTIGLITSMFTAIMGTRAVVNALYGAKPVKSISIGL